MRIKNVTQMNLGICEEKYSKHKFYLINPDIEYKRSAKFDHKHKMIVNVILLKVIYLVTYIIVIIFNNFFIMFVKFR